MSTLQISVLTAQHSRLDPKWNFRGRDPFTRLYFVLAGEAFVHHHGREFHLRPGGYYLIPSGTPARYRCPLSLEKYWCHLTAQVFGGMDVFTLIAPRYECRPANRAAIARLFERLIAVHRGDDAESLLEAGGIARVLLAPFFEGHPPSPAPDRIQAMRQFQPVLAHIEARLAERVGMAALAELAHMHPTYFGNRFSAVMGISPLQYLNRRRIERAQGLLWHGAQTLKQIAEQVGFGDVYYFSRLFKKKVGVSPSAYRTAKAVAEPGTE